MSDRNAVAPFPLQPLPWQQAAVDYLRREEPDVWQWFCSNRCREQYADRVRLDLLKSTYRLELQAHPDLHALATEVQVALGLAAPMTLYQAIGGDGSGMNAALAWLPGEIHIVFHGPILQALAPGELRALLGHEMSHFLLYTRQDGDHLVAGQVLDAMASDAAADRSHAESARLAALYTEIYSDRGALAAGANPADTIAMLVKIATGLTAVSAESFLRQAEEIVSRSGAHAEQLTHPEAYIRARAIDRWVAHDSQADIEIARMIEGPLALGSLDLLARRTLEDLTRDLIGAFFGPACVRTDGTVALARRYFPDFTPAALRDRDLDGVRLALRAGDPSIADYVRYVLLDFAAADPEIDEAALAQALLLARHLDFEEEFANLAAKELRRTKRKLQKIGAQAEQVLARAEAEHPRCPETAR